MPGETWGVPSYDDRVQARIHNSGESSTSRITSRIKDFLGQEAFRPVGEVSLKGKAAKLTLYAVN